MPKRQPQRASLTNEKYNDREVLYLLDDVSDRDGLSSSDDFADRLGISPASRVSTRLSWMRRYGYIESVDPRTVTGRDNNYMLWRITKAGRQVMSGKITRVVESALGKMDPGSQVVLMGELTRRAYVESSYTVSSAVRREYLHQAAKRVARK